MGSRIWQPFRALGLISDGVRFATQKRGHDNFVCVSIGRTYQMYNCKKLNLLFVGKNMNRRIRAIAVNGDDTFVASGAEIYSFRRTEQTNIFKGHSGKVYLLLCLGDYLISYGQDNMMKVWRTDTAEMISEIQFPDDFNATVLMHPDTYLNKVIVWNDKGQMELWNINTQKCIHKFKSWGSGVTCCEQSPVVDVVAVGLHDGRIVLHNLRADQTITTFQMEEGPVVSLAFRSDGKPVLASGNESGQLALWDLEKKTLIRTMDIHDGAVSSLHFLPNEPILLTSSADNSLRMWIFDSYDGSARLLRERSGHGAPPTRVRFYGLDDSHHLLSAGLDRAFRCFNTIRDEQNRELSQSSRARKKAKVTVAADTIGVVLGGYASQSKKKMGYQEGQGKRLNPIVDFDWNTVQERRWANIITCHQDDCQAYTWKFKDKVMGEHVLRPPGKAGHGHAPPVKAVAISACGNFALTGTGSGRLDVFNLQSGLHRAGTQAHSGPIRALASDAYNNTIFTVGCDGQLKLWAFKDLKLKDAIAVGCPVSQMILSRENDLVILACDDLAIRVYDVLTKRLVRHFLPHPAHITDMSLSPDARWLVTTCVDGAVRTFDLPSGMLVDHFLTPQAPTGVTFSPTTDFIATSHVGSLGVHLWANRFQYSAPVLRPIRLTNKPARLPLPAPFGISDAEVDAVNQQFNERDDASRDPSKLDCSPLATDLITFANFTSPTWQALTNLHAIKLRNKAKEVVKAVEAPFFLPTVSGLKPMFKVDDAAKQQDDNSEESRFIKLGGITHESPFTAALASACDKGDFSEPLGQLMNMSASAIDVEIRSLSFHDNYRQLRQMMAFMEHQLRSRTHFEIVQATLHVFLEVHGDTLASQDDLRARLQRLQACHSTSWKSLETVMHANLCLITYFTGMSAV